MGGSDVAVSVLSVWVSQFGVWMMHGHVHSISDFRQERKDGGLELHFRIGMDDETG